MGHYTDDSSSVRVDFFKPSGKWYTTEAVIWTGNWAKDEGLIYDAFTKSLRDHLGTRLSDMVAVCIEPYHELSFPLMLGPGTWLE